MKCPYCKIKMKKMKGFFEDEDIGYEYYKCSKCKEELLDMKQLHELAEKQRAREITFSKWGNSIAVRISKDFLDKLDIKEGDHGYLIKHGKELRIIPA